MSEKHNGFFAIRRDTFIQACELGVNPGTALLVLARGTGGDNITTAWSAEAASKRLGLRWTAAKEAIAALIKAGIVIQLEGRRPRYKLAQQGDAIWLPNTIVDGVGQEIPPVHKLRQMQDPMALRLFGELYAEQNLREDGGITQAVTYRSYTREKIGQFGASVVWYFTYENAWVAWGNPATDPHFIKDANKGKQGKDFFRRFAMLESAGLIEWVPYLYEGPKGEPIHPLAWNGMDIEKDLYHACVAAGRALLTANQRDWLDANRSGGWLVPAPAHIGEVAMIGVARLKYRPHTRLTAAWWADYQTRCEQFTAAYRESAGSLRIAV
ncbi:MAG: hypothetical protein QM581_06510 [Pseudomonas sp.]